LVIPRPIISAKLWPLDFQMSSFEVGSVWVLHNYFALVGFVAYLKAELDERLHVVISTSWRSNALCVLDDLINTICSLLATEPSQVFGVASVLRRFSASHSSLPPAAFLSTSAAPCCRTLKCGQATHPEVRQVRCGAASRSSARNVYARTGLHRQRASAARLSERARSAPAKIAERSAACSRPRCSQHGPHDAPSNEARALLLAAAPHRTCLTSEPRRYRARGVRLRRRKCACARRRRNSCAGGATRPRNPSLQRPARRVL
jgi:hypothetical protein